MQKLDTGANKRAIVVHAPAGYGKSSILAQWYASLISRSVPTAWLTLDEYDNDPYQFLSYIIAACHAAKFSINYELPHAPQILSGAAPQTIASAVIAALGKCHRPAVLILDDYHRAESGIVNEIVGRMIADLAPNLQIVMSSRTCPQELNLAELRAHGELLELSRSELGFSVADTEECFSAVKGVAPTREWCTELVNRVEGWPIAVLTVRRWLDDNTAIETVLEQVSGRSSDLSDYFLEQVFQDLAPETQSFLIRTAIFERVSGDLGNAICGISNGWDILESLERQDLFVECLDRDREWYRYHNLFSEFLLERLRRSAIYHADELAAQAARWFQANGYEIEAVQYALDSNDPTLIGGLFESLGGWQYGGHGNLKTLRQALASLDDETIHRYPRVWLGKVFSNLKAGNLDIAEEQFAEFRRAYANEADRDTLLRSEIQIMHGLISSYCDHGITTGEVAALEEQEHQLPKKLEFLHGVRCTLLCAIYCRKFQFQDAITSGDEAIRNFRRCGSFYGEVYIYFHQGSAFYAQGRLRDAVIALTEGYNLAVDHLGSESDLVAIGSVFLAQVAYAQNELTKARNYLDDALPHIEHYDAWLEVYVAAYETALALARLDNDPKRFASLYQKAKATAVNRGLQQLHDILSVLELDYKVRDQRGREVSVDSTLVAKSISKKHELACDYQARLNGRILIELRQFTEAEEALAAQAQQAFECGRIMHYISLATLQSLAIYASGKTDRALQVFERALSSSIFEGIKRPFIDEGQPIADLLSCMGKHERSNRLRDSFISEIVFEAAKEHNASSQPSQILSSREREVLRHLAKGRTNREISEMMGLSINTVKFHLKNIFGKFEVRTRREAVDAALRGRLI